MVGRWRRTVRVLVVGLVTATGCSGGDDGGAQVPVVLVPNDVLADIVGRVACVGDIAVSVSDPAEEAGNGDGGADRPPPSVEVTLGEDPTSRSEETFVVSIPEAVDTIERPNGDVEVAVWMDPARTASLIPAIAGALVAGAGLDAELVDRCVARVLTELEQLDVELADRLSSLDVDDRIIDVSEPGVVYFASRYDFATGTGPRAVEAGTSITVDTLGGAGSYDAMMLANADRVVAVLD